MPRSRPRLVPALVVFALAGGVGACREGPVDFDTHCREVLGLAPSECAAVAAFRLPETLPPARGNAHADDARAAELGRAIFFDPGFARVPGVSCATCHAPARTFQDGVAVPEVVPGSPGTRNTPTLLDAARLETAFFWDGRADSLWSQPLSAFENPIEMDASRLRIAHRIAEISAYRAPYEAIFGPLPPLEDEARFPMNGRPGEPAFDTMTPADQDAVNRVAANVGKALEAYQRKLVSGPARLDRYLDGEFDALDATEARGLVRFVKSGCYACHSGPMLTDGAFYATSETVDRGRAAGIEALLASPFNAAGPYFDRGAGTPLPLPLGPEEADEHAFRTPTLRHVTRTAPYGRAGARTLADVLDTPGILYQPGDEIVIAAFFQALEGTPPPAKWLAPP